MSPLPHFKPKSLMEQQLSIHFQQAMLPHLVYFCPGPSGNCRTVTELTLYGTSIKKTASKRLPEKNEEKVMSSGSGEGMQQCDHEEADTRICVHLKNALDKDARTILVRTVDTDVIVIPIGQFFHFHSTYPDMDIWVAFGMGKHFQYISINTVCRNLGAEKSMALPSFHAYTGCDTTSQFRGKGEKICLGSLEGIPRGHRSFHQHG